MHVVIFGGSGRTGRLVVDEAISRGHTVAALVRDPASLKAKPGLTIVQGSPLNAEDVEKAFTAVPDTTPSAVLVALNNARTSDNPFAASVSPPRLMYDSHQHIIAAMKKHGVKKIVTLQSLGVGDSFKNLVWIMRVLVKRSNMAVGFEDHNLVDKTIRESELDYVLARPIRLADGPSAPIKFYGDKGDGIGGFVSITRSSVACFLVDAAEKGDWDRSTPVISN